MTRIEALQAQFRIDSRLLRINLALDIAELTEQEKNMAVDAAAAALIAAFDAATDKIAARIQKLIDASTTLSADDQAAFQAEVDKLNKLGEDPTNPIPPSV